jgi:hypothetical protein
VSVADGLKPASRFSIFLLQVMVEKEDRLCLSLTRK